MIVFLTSSPTGPLDGSYKVEGLDPKNHFIENLRQYWKFPARCLMITAFPADHAASEEMTEFFRGALARSGFETACMDLWDDRTAQPDRELLHSYDVIFLGGGHVPTQNAFFKQLGLRELLEGYEGIVIGISAGSMNSADTVYVQPEEAGEAVDPTFVRFTTGLNLTDIQLIPHYQMVKDRYLDGMRLYEEITFGDSRGHQFLSIPDGSYLLITPDSTAVWGEARWIRDGEIYRFCVEGERCEIN